MPRGASLVVVSELGIADDLGFRGFDDDGAGLDHVGSEERLSARA